MYKVYTVWPAARRYFLMFGRSNILDIRPSHTYYIYCAGVSISLYYNIGRARLYNDYKNVMFIWRLRICHNPMSISPSLICYELLFTCLWLYILFCSIVIIFISEKIYRHWRKQCKQTYKLRLIIIKWQKKWLCSLEVSILQRQVFFFFFLNASPEQSPTKQHYWQRQITTYFVCSIYFHATRIMD